MELDTSGFATQGPTVFAGNIGDNKYIIQVSPMGIRLLEGGKIKTRLKQRVCLIEASNVTCSSPPLPPVTQLHFIPVDLGSPIVHCSVADPYVVIMTAEGVVTMFVLKTDTYMGKTHRLALQKPQIPTVSQAFRSISTAPSWTSRPSTLFALRSCSSC